MTVDYNKLNIIQKVGEGSFATVYYGTSGDDHSELAIKKLSENMTGDSNAEIFNEFRQEVKRKKTKIYFHSLFIFFLFDRFL